MAVWVARVIGPRSSQGVGDGDCVGVVGTHTYPDWTHKISWFNCVNLGGSVEFWKLRLACLEESLWIPGHLII